MTWNDTVSPKNAAPSSIRAHLRRLESPSCTALRYVKMSAARAHGRKASACIFVLCPTCIICTLYEQNVMAIAPPAAIKGLTPSAKSSRNAPSSEMKKYVAGRLPVSNRSYTGCIRSPLVELIMGAVGMPENIDPVHLAKSPGLSLFHARLSCDIPTQPVMSP